MTDEVTAAQLPPDARNGLVAELAEIVIERTAPEELVLFQENAAEYFRDPRAALKSGDRDEPVGFGLDMVMMTPYVLAVVAPVVQFLVTTMVEAVAEESATHVVDLVRRRFLRGRPADDEPAGGVEPLSEEQLRQVREVALRAAQGVRLDDGQANLLADAVVGGLVKR
ncbi:hypothetical protein [Nonomuraea sp. NPDC049480]|uniref:hypothetical protein n=1 Tax=Nonomuraea sp. NPDC049480 TaxID=3364353 RepID=UPI0037A839F7